MMQRVETSWKAIEEVLWEHAHSVFKALKRPATAIQLDRLEHVLGARLPADMRRSLSVHNGMRSDACLYDAMVLLPARRIAQEWRMRCDVHKNDDTGGCPKTRDRRIRNDRWWREGWVPFLEESGNMLLVDLDPGPGGKVGQVIRFDNSSGRPRIVIAPSFTEWLNAVAEVLACRRFHLSELGDIWLDAGELS